MRVPLRGVSFWEQAPPMGPCQDCPTSPKNQPPTRVSRCPCRARRPRRRVCLLKGCGHVFRPEQPRARYCGEACREQARRWRQWKARRRYRQSPNGKQQRQAQSRRYRERRPERPALETAPVTAARVIPTKFFLCTCDRPGCYAEFVRTRRSPQQRFCSSACRQAVERVRERERRWRERRRQAEGGRRGGEEFGLLGAESGRYRPAILRSSQPLATFSVHTPTE